MELLMMAKDDKLSDYYDYLRTRIRISRSSALNFLLIAVIFPIFARTRLNEVTAVWNERIAVVTSLTCFAVAALALFT